MKPGANHKRFSRSEGATLAVAPKRERDKRARVTAGGSQSFREQPARVGLDCTPERSARGQFPALASAAPTGRRRSGQNVSKLFQLPADQLQQLCAWLAEGATLVTVRQRLKKRFKFSVSLDSLSRFWSERLAAAEQPEQIAPLLETVVCFQGVPHRLRIEALPGAKGGQS